MQLRPQPAVSRLPITGFSETRGEAGVEESSVFLSYTLWRFADDRTDSRNEIEMDEATRQALEEEPDWERPPWLIEQTRLFRYPMLWEAVRTSWYPSIPHPSAALTTQIAQHANHILRNVSATSSIYPPELDTITGGK